MAEKPAYPASTLVNAPVADPRNHERKAGAERVAGGSIMLGRFLAVLAAVVLLLLLWWRS